MDEPAIFMIKALFHIERLEMLIESVFDFAAVKNVDQRAQAGAAGVFYIVIDRHIQQRHAFYGMIILHVKRKILAPGKEWVEAQMLGADDVSAIHFIPKRTEIETAGLFDQFHQEFLFGHQ